MQTGIFDELFPEETNDEEEGVAVDAADIVNDAVVVDTALFRIEFKKAAVGEHEVDLSKGVHGLNVFALADKLVTDMAKLIVMTQALLYGDEAVAAGTAPKVQAAFPKGELASHIRESLSASTVATIEHNFAQITAMGITVKQLQAAKTALFPQFRGGLQLAWNPSAATAAERTITDFKAAVDYRIENSPELRRVRDRVAATTSGVRVDALSFANADQILNF